MLLQKALTSLCKYRNKDRYAMGQNHKSVHLKLQLMKKRASQKILGKKVKNSCISSKIYQKTCISKIFGPNSKTCIVKVCAAWGRVSRGLTVLRVLLFLRFLLQIFWTLFKNLYCQVPCSLSWGRVSRGLTVLDYI